MGKNYPKIPPTTPMTDQEFWKALKVATKAHEEKVKLAEELEASSKTALKTQAAFWDEYHKNPKEAIKKNFYATMDFFKEVQQRGKALCKKCGKPKRKPVIPW